MSMDDLLRQQCRELKIYQGINYSEIADYLEIKKNSFYNWMKGQYTFSQERQNRLKEVITCLKEV